MILVYLSQDAPCSGKQKVKIADGSYSAIARKRTIKISKKLYLQSVLHVPNFSVNLLSVSKLSTDLNCVAVLSFSNCVFRTFTQGRRLGLLKKRMGSTIWNRTNKTSLEDVVVLGIQIKKKKFGCGIIDSVIYLLFK